MARRGNRRAARPGLHRATPTPASGRPRLAVALSASLAVLAGTAVAAMLLPSGGGTTGPVPPGEAPTSPLPAAKAERSVAERGPAGPRPTRSAAPADRVGSSHAPGLRATTRAEASRSAGDLGGPSARRAGPTRTTAPARDGETSDPTSAPPSPDETPQDDPDEDPGLLPLLPGGDDSGEEGSSASG